MRLKGNVESRRAHDDIDLVFLAVLNERVSRRMGISPNTCSTFGCHQRFEINRHQASDGGNYCYSKSALL